MPYTKYRRYCNFVNSFGSTTLELLYSLLPSFNSTTTLLLQPFHLSFIFFHSLYLRDIQKPNPSGRELGSTRIGRAGGHISRRRGTITTGKKARVGFNDQIGR
jgi:hypothetical protein